jgi:hypothetical protein
MQTVMAAVGTARRRMILDSAVRALPWTLLGASAGFLLLVGLRSITAADGLLNPWNLGVLAGLGLLSPIYIAWRNRPDDLRAAVEIDRRLNLGERLSTALRSELPEADFADAVRRDAERHAGRLVVARDFPLNTPPGMWMFAVPLVVGLAVWRFVTPVNLFERTVEPDQPDPARQAELARKVQEAKPELAKKAEALKEKVADKAAKEDLEAAMQKAAEAKTPAEADKALRQMMKAANERLNKPDANQLRALQQSLARQAGQDAKSKTGADLQKALKNNDLDAAKQAAAAMQKKLDQLRDELTKEKDPEKREAAKQEAAKIQDDLANMAEALKQAVRDKQLERQLESAGMTPEEARRRLDELSKPEDSPEQKQAERQIKDALEKKGLTKEQIEKMLQRTKEQAAKNQKTSELAEKLQKAADALQKQKSMMNGQEGEPNWDEAQEALKEAGEQLGDLEQLADQLNDLESSLSELEELRKQLEDPSRARSEFKGQNPGEGEGEGEGEGGKGKGKGKGNGLGEGVGSGERPVKKTDFKTEFDKVRGTQKGIRSVGVQLVDGDNLPGEDRIGYVGQLKAGKAAAANMMKNEAIPSQYHDAVKRYYDLGRGETPAKK